MNRAQKGVFYGKHRGLSPTGNLFAPPSGRGAAPDANPIASVRNAQRYAPPGKFQNTRKAAPFQEAAIIDAKTFRPAVGRLIVHSVSD